MNKNEILSLNADILLMRVLKYSKYVKMGLPDIVVSSELDKIIQCLFLSMNDVKGIKKQFIDEGVLRTFSKQQEDLIESTNGDLTFIHANINSELLGRLDELILFKKFQDEEEQQQKMNEAKGISDINKAKWSKIEEAVRKELEEDGFFE